MYVYNLEAIHIIDLARVHPYKGTLFSKFLKVSIFKERIIY
jgi:hypothetical protein